MSALAAEAAIQITEIKEHIGAEVRGPICANLSRGHPATNLRRPGQNVTVVIRDQDLTATQYRQATEQFGELMEDQNRMYLAEGEPLVSVLSNRLKASDGQPAKVGANAIWHTDHTNQERPRSTASMPLNCPTAVALHRSATCAPPTKPCRKKCRAGWDKSPANTLISSARFKIANPDILAAQKASTEPPMAHPLIRTHPDYGTKAIWFHKSKTETVSGLNPQETQDFLIAFTVGHQARVHLSSRMAFGRHADDRQPRRHA